jgi:hypothetical protein
MPVTAPRVATFASTKRFFRTRRYLAPRTSSGARSVVPIAARVRPQDERVVPFTPSGHTLSRYWHAATRGHTLSLERHVAHMATRIVVHSGRVFSGVALALSKKVDREVQREPFGRCLQRVVVPSRKPRGWHGHCLRNSTEAQDENRSFDRRTQFDWRHVVGDGRRHIDTVRSVGWRALANRWSDSG